MFIYLHYLALHDKLQNKINYDFLQNVQLCTVFASFVIQVLVLARNLRKF